MDDRKSWESEGFKNEDNTTDLDAPKSETSVDYGDPDSDEFEGLSAVNDEENYSELEPVSSTKKTSNLKRRSSAAMEKPASKKNKNSSTSPLKKRPSSAAPMNYSRVKMQKTKAGSDVGDSVVRNTAPKKSEAVSGKLMSASMRALRGVNSIHQSEKEKMIDDSALGSAVDKGKGKGIATDKDGSSDDSL